MTGTGRSIVLVEDETRLEEVISAVESAHFQVLDRLENLGIFLVDAEFTILTQALKDVEGIIIEPEREVKIID